MPWVLQGSNNTGIAAAATSTTQNLNGQPGYLIVWYVDVDSNVSAITPAANANVTWGAAAIGPSPAQNGVQTWIVYGLYTKSGAPTLTLNFTGAATNGGASRFEMWSGNALNINDVYSGITNNGNGATGTPGFTLNGVPTGGLVTVVANNNSAAWTAGAGFNLGGSTSPWNSVNRAGYENQPNSAGGSVFCLWGSPGSTAWTQIAAAFNPAPSAGFQIYEGPGISPSQIYQFRPQLYSNQTLQQSAQLTQQAFSWAAGTVTPSSFQVPTFEPNFGPGIAPYNPNTFRPQLASNQILSQTVATGLSQEAFAWSAGTMVGGGGVIVTLTQQAFTWTEGQLTPSQPPPSGLVVPNLVGMILQEAEHALQVAGILVPTSIGYFGVWPITVIWVINPPTLLANNPSNFPVVIAQSIPPGSSGTPNMAITLTVIQPAGGVSYPGTQGAEVSP